MKLTTEQLPDAYERGICRDCQAPIQPLGPSSRCPSCDVKFSDYVASGWGLYEKVEERLLKKAYGLCYGCNADLEESDNRLCKPCQEQANKERWNQGRIRQTIITSDENPYRSIWDPHEGNTSNNLTPTYGSMAQRLRDKARYFQRKAELQGGPEGRKYAQEAWEYLQISKELQEKWINRTNLERMPCKIVVEKVVPETLDPDIKQEMYQFLGQWLGLEEAF